MGKPSTNGANGQTGRKWQYRLAFIHSDLDDVPLTSGARSVLMHLVRRAGNDDGVAFPSYQSIGDHCFRLDYANPRVRRRHAIAAIKELEAAGLVVKETRRIDERMNRTNLYKLVDPWQENGGYSTVTKVGTVECPGVGTGQYPKVSPIEVSPKEEITVVSSFSENLPETDQRPREENQVASVKAKKSLGQNTAKNRAEEEIIKAYLSALEEYEPNAIIDKWETRGTTATAKEIVAKGYTPEQVTMAVRKLKAEEFWAARHLSLGTVANNLGAIVATAEGKTAASRPMRRVKELF